jgi:hypothetical protein
MPRLRLLLPALAVLAVGVVLLARGGEQAAPPADPGGLVAQAFANASPVTSGRLALALDVEAPGAEPLRLRVEGPFAARGARGAVPRFDLAVRSEAGGETLETGLVSTGQAGFLRLAGQVYELDARSWAALRDGFAGAGEEGPGAALPRLGLDPRGWLRAPREAGRREEDGVEVVHLTAAADPAALARDLAGLVGSARALAGGAPRATAPAALGAALRDVRVELWTGAGDGSLRRLSVRGGLAPPGAAAGREPGSLRLDLRHTDLNAGVTVPDPEGARPLSELGATLTAGADAARDERYLRCLERAGSDAAALQRCASRLTRGG